VLQLALAVSRTQLGKLTTPLLLLLLLLPPPPLRPPNCCCCAGLASGTAADMNLLAAADQKASTNPKPSHIKLVDTSTKQNTSRNCMLTARRE
jgi:hypothetical protein